MKCNSKIATLVLAFLCLTSLVTLQLAVVKGQPSNMTAPGIEWQRNYFVAGSEDNSGIEAVSNLIQTIDGGYVFMDLGWSHQQTFTPTTVYKVDSSGNIQWKRTIDRFVGTTIIQTSDEGYEISGKWSTYGTTYIYTPTLLKTDPQANIEWTRNYSKVPDLGIVTSQNFGGSSSTPRIQTSDGGFAYWNHQLSNSSFQSTVKTDTNNRVQWAKNLTFASNYGIDNLYLTSLIETSDGALAALGVGYMIPGNTLTGRIYLVKTEPFLPLPSPTTLPTPIQKSSMILSEPFLESIIIAFALTIAVVVSLLFRRHLKNRELK